jgi:hypothetical protein
MGPTIFSHLSLSPSYPPSLLAILPVFVFCFFFAWMMDGSRATDVSDAGDCA